MPAQEIGDFCKEHGLLFILDTAQTAGTINIDMEKCHIDALAFTGHKGLRGPQGTGGFLIRNKLAAQIEPLIRLHAALCDLEKQSMEEIRQHELMLTQYFIDGILNLDPEEKFLRIIGKKNIENRCAVVSVQTLHMDMAQAAFELDSTYGIMTRVGLHCAPNAHKTLGTYPDGTLRFSFGPENTKQELDIALDALSALL